MGLTPEEALILKRLQDKQMAAQQQDKQEDVKPEATPLSSAGKIYASAVTQVQKLTSM